jgi:hypothetical protein
MFVSYIPDFLDFELRTLVLGLLRFLTPSMLETYFVWRHYYSPLFCVGLFH